MRNASEFNDLARELVYKLRGCYSLELLLQILSFGDDEHPSYTLEILHEDACGSIMLISDDPMNEYGVIIVEDHKDNVSILYVTDYIKTCETLRLVTVVGIKGLMQLLNEQEIVIE